MNTLATPTAADQVTTKAEQRYSYVQELYCPRCDARYSHAVLQQLWQCGSPLLVHYDLEALNAAARELSTLGEIASSERVVALNTGAGIKYPDSQVFNIDVLDKESAIPVTGSAVASGVSNERT
ncbi:hypothetical protein [Vreelandella olivaria]|uniref:hypothetical protein n=1 Tax=Vreelandella olivaria TaxID=390919 RepID=UPI00201EB0DB|nr:hypothetical protein [Halomonas olivaria]